MENLLLGRLPHELREELGRFLRCIKVTIEVRCRRESSGIFDDEQRHVKTYAHLENSYFKASLASPAPRRSAKRGTLRLASGTGDFDFEVDAGANVETGCHKLMGLTGCAVKTADAALLHVLSIPSLLDDMCVSNRLPVLQREGALRLKQDVVNPLLTAKMGQWHHCMVESWFVPETFVATIDLLLGRWQPRMAGVGNTHDVLDLGSLQLYFTGYGYHEEVITGPPLARVVLGRQI